MRKIFSGLLLTALSSTALASVALSESATNVQSVTTNINVVANGVLQTNPSIVELQTNLGTIAIELNWTKAPLSSQNFINYANKDFYNNTLFHRVVKNFVIQGGGVDSVTGQFKTPDATIKNEADNGLSNVAGSVAMARSTAAGFSATSQFFVNLKDNTFLDKNSTTPGYAVFGTVIHGMDIVNKIGALSLYSPSGDSATNGGLPFTVNNTNVFVEAVYKTDAIDAVNSFIRIVQPNDSGRVTSSPASAIDCGLKNTTCIVSKPIGKSITLIAKPAAGFEFGGWRGDCQKLTTTITVKSKIGNQNCTAIFNKITP